MISWTVGSFEHAPSNPREDTRAMRAERMAEAELLPGSLQFNYSRYGDEASTYYTGPRHSLQRFPVSCTPVLIRRIDSLTKTDPSLRAS